MDNAIRFKESHISIVLYAICFFIAGYSINVADVSILLRFTALIGLILLTYTSIREDRRRKALRGLVRLTAKGLIPLEDNLDRATETYQANVVQRLPWCINIELKHSAGTFRQLVWRDSLAADDWRRFRAYLTELPSSSLAN